MSEDVSDDWPGVVHREGRTLTRVSMAPDSSRSGPVSRREGAFFSESRDVRK